LGAVELTGHAGADDDLAQALPEAAALDDAKLRPQVEGGRLDAAQGDVGAVDRFALLEQLGDHDQLARSQRLAVLTLADARCQLDQRRLTAAEAGIELGAGAAA